MTQKKEKREWIMLCGVIKGTWRRKFTCFPIVNVAFTKCNKQSLSLELYVSHTLTGTCSFVDMIFHVLCVMPYAARMVSYVVFIPTRDLRYEPTISWLYVPIWLYYGCDHYDINYQKAVDLSIYVNQPYQQQYFRCCGYHSHTNYRHKLR